jgi:hypothetical protein
LKSVRHFVVRLVVLTSIVYTSNLISAGVIALRIAHALKREIHPTVLYVLPPHQFLESPALTLAAFWAVGVAARPYFGAVDRYFDGFPWAEIDLPNVIVPFRVTVRWSYCAAPLAGAGYRTRCWCIFGLVLSREDVMTWVS